MLVWCVEPAPASLFCLFRGKNRAVASSAVGRGGLYPQEAESNSNHIITLESRFEPWRAHCAHRHDTHTHTRFCKLITRVNTVDNGMDNTERTTAQRTATRARGACSVTTRILRRKSGMPARAPWSTGASCKGRRLPHALGEDVVPRPLHDTTIAPSNSRPAGPCSRVSSPRIPAAEADQTPPQRNVRKGGARGPGSQAESTRAAFRVLAHGHTVAAASMP
eukprot:scaffold2584_cov113-Isochrysis_galbana.AAC.3